MVQITERDIELAALLAQPIDDLELPYRAYKGLKYYGVETIADLCIQRQKGNLPKVRSVGKKTLGEIEFSIRRYLERHGYTIRGSENDTD